MKTNCVVVVPWHREQEIEEFLKQWGIPRGTIPDWLVLQHDSRLEGCGVTKNKGIRYAVDKLGAEIVIVLDGDCYPAEIDNLIELTEAHLTALEPQRVRMFETVTEPPSRGTPYAEHHIIMPVAASMGFWTEIGDYCAVRQLAFQQTPMIYKRSILFSRYFSLCGMNIAFKPKEWSPWCQFIDVPRFDDIWMGWLWQKEAYRKGFCFNLNGPSIRHARQSNVWKNLLEESIYLEQSETLWRDIALHESCDYETLRSLLPC